MPRAVVRADASASIGAGHVVRCLSLAGELQARGIEVAFVTRAPDAIVERITETGVAVHQLAAEGPGAEQPPGALWSTEEQAADAAAVGRLLERPADVMIVDHYGLDHRWEQDAPAPVVAVLDDLANRPHACALLVDHNWYGPRSGHRYDGLADGATLLLGPRYALLQPEYRALRADLDHTWPPRRVLVSFGGTDATGETAKAVSALDDPTLAVDVVIGSPDRVPAALAELVARTPTTRLHVAVPSLAPLLAAADLAIGASGSATWERICLDVPALVTTTSTHQSGVTAALHQHAMTDWLGLAANTTVDDYRSAVNALMSGRRPTVPPLVDGWGAARVATWLAARLGIEHPHLTVRPAAPEDRGTVIGLAAESSGDITAGWDGGVFGDPAEWFRETDAHVAAVGSSERPRWTIELAGCPVGLALRAGEQLDVLLDRVGRSMLDPGEVARAVSRQSGL